MTIEGLKMIGGYTTSRERSLGTMSTYSRGLTSTLITPLYS